MMLASVDTGILVLGWAALVAYFGVLALAWRQLSPFRLSVPGIAFTAYLILLLLPALILAPQQPIETASNRFVLGTLSAGLFMLAGMALCRLLYPAPAIDLKEYLRAPIEPPREHAMLVPLGILLGVTLLAAVLRYILVGGIPLIYMLTHLYDFAGIAAAKTEAKVAAGALQGGIIGIGIRLVFYLVGWSTYMFIPLLGMAAQTRNKQTGDSKWFVLYILCFLFALFFGMWDAYKSPGARITMIFLAGTLLIRGRISWKILLGVGLVIALPLAVAVATHPASMERSQIYSAMFTRAFAAPAQVTYYYFELFPTVEAHTWGRGTFVLGDLLGRGNAMIPLMVARYVSHDPRTSTFLNCGFIGTGWAEFSYMGVLVYSMLGGGLAQFVQNFIMRRAVTGKRLELVWMQAIQIPLWTVTFVSAGITQFFLGQGLLVSLVMVGWLRNHFYGRGDESLAASAGRYAGSPPMGPASWGYIEHGRLRV